MKKLIALMAVVLSFNVLADNVDDLFSGGEREFDFDGKFTRTLQEQVDEDARVACNGALCVLHSVDNRYGGFEVSFTLGNETSTYGNGTNIIIGEDGNGGYDQVDNSDDINWAVKVSYKRGKCTQSVHVPRSVYKALNTYMYGLVEEGGTRRNFTPADEAMIMFYTTIMNKLDGCTMQ